MPSITGMAMSSSTRSGWLVLASSTACSPSAAVATTCQPSGWRSMTKLISSRRSAESSTTRTLTFSVIVGSGADGRAADRRSRAGPGASTASSPIQRRAWREVPAIACGPRSNRSRSRAISAVTRPCTMVSLTSRATRCRSAWADLRGDLLLDLLLHGQVSEHQAPDQDAVEVEGGRGHQDGNLGAALLARERELGTLGSPSASATSRAASDACWSRTDEGGEVPTDHAVAVDTEEAGELGVGEEDDAARGDGGRALAHALDDDPVGTVRAGERVDLLLLRVAHRRRRRRHRC